MALAMEEVSEILQDIEERNNGVLLAPQVVEEARPEDHPLHSKFNWDDSSAAQQWRIQQARVLINEVTIFIQKREVRKYESVTYIVGEVEQRSYVNVERILQNPSLRKQVLAEALVSIKHWQDKYNLYKELEGVVKIDEEKLQQAEQLIAQME